MAELNEAYRLVRDAGSRERHDRARARTHAFAPRAASAIGRRRRRARPRGHQLEFGRYAGWTLRDLARQDPDYLRWLSRHASGLRYRTEIYRSSAGWAPPPPERSRHRPRRGRLGPMTSASPSPLRAIFLDIGDTVMRPTRPGSTSTRSPSTSSAIEVSPEDLQQALRAGLPPRRLRLRPTGSSRRARRASGARSRSTRRRSRELGLGPMPDEFFRRLSELFMLTSHWHVFPDAYAASRRSARAASRSAR